MTDFKNAKEMTAQEIEDVLIEYKNDKKFAPLILVPCMFGVPYNGFFLMPKEIEPGSIEDFLADLNIAGKDNPNLRYYLVRVYRAEYFEGKTKSLRVV